MATRKAKAKTRSASPKTPAKSKPAAKRSSAPKAKPKAAAKRAAGKSAAPARKAARKAPPRAKPRVETQPRTALLASKCTPVAFVDAIEPVLPFWAAVGFFPTVTVPHGDRAGFVILSNGQVELMYQSWSLLREDMPALAARSNQADKVFLFVEVGDIDAVARALSGHEVFLPRRETFYGSTEIGFREPQGHHVTFAQFKNRSPV